MCISYNPKSLLNKYQLKAKKRLSQNFLTDKALCERIVEIAGIESTDQVIEIGPGLGALTQAIVNRVDNQVIAIEKDRDMCAILERIFPSEQLTLLCEDVLEVFLSKLVSNPCIVLGNLPYQITSPIVGLLAENAHLLKRAVLMVQKEVALRMCAEKASTHNSSFSIFCQSYFTTNIAFVVDRSSFFPQPGVDSAIVVLEPHEQLKPLPPSFFSFVQASFQKRRKMLKSTHKGFTIEDYLINLGCNRLARPQDLSTEEFMALFQLIQKDGYKA